MPSYGIKRGLSKVNPCLVLLPVALRITVKIIAARPLHMTSRSKQESNRRKGKREYANICSLLSSYLGFEHMIGLGACRDILVKSVLVYTWPTWLYCVWSYIAHAIPPLCHIHHTYHACFSPSGRNFNVPDEIKTKRAVLLLDQAVSLSDTSVVSQLGDWGEIFSNFHTHV